MGQVGVPYDYCTEDVRLWAESRKANKGRVDICVDPVLVSIW
jgi:hypothetical protein